eukprot:gnl/MRDRNA2_/MRDRNA2_25574_c0_seq1.p1 gnl/MRDRNA2_/MRDRNA2_25574_c0~~gnl/MRDRNA2_/MRDRNA2_25574_c0_seq1.p1  ORF type:complete len:327 (+),score=85.24 gnl/MRDRNA2_/MRDRNA2_25574_c0_seq1:136-981(+)
MEDLKEKVESLFPSIGASMFMLFKVMNGNQAVLTPVFELVPVTKALFCVFIVATSWALLSILTAVLSENMMSVNQEQEKDQAEYESELRAEKCRQDLTSLFKVMDVDGNGTLTEDEFKHALGEKTFNEILEAMQLDDADMEELWEYLSTDGVCKSSDFTEGLLQDSTMVSERSLMRLEKRVALMIARCGQYHRIVDSVVDAQYEEDLLVERLERVLLRLEQAGPSGIAALKEKAAKLRLAKGEPLILKSKMEETHAKDDPWMSGDAWSLPPQGDRKSEKVV